MRAIPHIFPAHILLVITFVLSFHPPQGTLGNSVSKCRCFYQGRKEELIWGEWPVVCHPHCAITAQLPRPWNPDTSYVFLLSLILRHGGFLSAPCILWSKAYCKHLALTMECCPVVLNYLHFCFLPVTAWKCLLFKEVFSDVPPNVVLFLVSQCLHCNLTWLFIGTGFYYGSIHLLANSSLWAEVLFVQGSLICLVLIHCCNLSAKNIAHSDCPTNTC